MGYNHAASFWSTSLITCILLLSPPAKAMNFTAKTIFEKPFITGASVSADWNTKSPGKTLALRFTGAPKIQTVAIGGRPGKEMIKQVEEAKLNDRTIIIAIDFLFWDSTLSDFGSSHSALDKLVGLASARKIPIVLGEIPELLPGRQGLRQELNADIKKICASYENCYLMPFDRLYQELVKNGYLEIKGKKYKMAELIPDGMHLSSPATEYLADIMLDLLTKKSGA